MNKSGLSEDTIQKLKAIFKSHPKIEKVVLYGSKAKGTYKPGSDIDLTCIAPTMDLSELLRLENQIEDLLLPYKVDLSLFHTIENPDLIDHINRVGIEF